MFCNTSLADIHYEIIGDGIPVILLHGFPIDSEMMKFNFEPVFNGEQSNVFRRIYVDLPGMGRSTTTFEKFSCDHMVATLLEFIDKVIPHQRFVVVGQSYGGYLARAILFHRLELAIGLFLLCPLITKVRRVPARTVLEKDEVFLASLKKDVREDFLNITVIANENIWNYYYTKIQSAINRADQDVIKRLRANGYCASYNVDELPAKFKGPTSIVTGFLDDVVGYHDAFDLLQNFERASFFVLEKAGHLLEAEQKEMFRGIVGDWIRKLGDF